MRSKNTKPFKVLFCLSIFLNINVTLGQEFKESNWSEGKNIAFTPGNMIPEIFTYADGQSVLFITRKTGEGRYFADIKFLIQKYDATDLTLEKEVTIGTKHTDYISTFTPVDVQFNNDILYLFGLSSQTAEEISFTSLDKNLNLIGENVLITTRAKPEFFEDYYSFASLDAKDGVILFIKNGKEYSFYHSDDGVDFELVGIYDISEFDHTNEERTATKRTAHGLEKTVPREPDVLFTSMVDESGVYFVMEHPKTFEAKYGRFLTTSKRTILKFDFIEENLYEIEVNYGGFNCAKDFWSNKKWLESETDGCKDQFLNHKFIFNEEKIYVLGTSYFPYEKGGHIYLDILLNEYSHDLNDSKTRVLSINLDDYADFLKTDKLASKWPLNPQYYKINPIDIFNTPDGGKAVFLQINVEYVSSARQSISGYAATGHKMPPIQNKKPKEVQIAGRYSYQYDIVALKLDKNGNLNFQEIIEHRRFAPEHYGAYIGGARIISKGNEFVICLNDFDEDGGVSVIYVDENLEEISRTTLLNQNLGFDFYNALVDSNEVYLSSYSIEPFSQFGLDRDRIKLTKLKF